MVEPGAQSRTRYRRSTRPARGSHTPRGSAYEPRRPDDTLLYRIVEEHLDELRELAADRYAKPLPRYVVETFQAFLKCGRLEHGFVRCRCDGCGHELLVPFSCGHRGVCLSCATRRMSNTAAHLVDRVLPGVPIRQWVLSLPFELRLLAARKPQVLAATGRIFVQEVFRRGRCATALHGSHAGAVCFTHRAGGSLNLNPHHHVAALDGVFLPRASAESTLLRFVQAPAPSHGELQAVAERVHRRTVRWLDRRGFLQEQGPAAIADDLESESAGDALSRWAMTGSGYERFDEAAKSAPAAHPALKPRGQGRLGADCEGFNVNASVWIRHDDDVARERLMRYGGRPAFASDRLSELDDGRVAYRIRYARRGATHRVMTPVELLARLAALIPPHRHPLTRYFGVLSSHSKHRSQVVPRRPAPRVAPTVRALPAGADSSTTSRKPPQAASSQRKQAPHGRDVWARVDSRLPPTGHDHPVLIPLAACPPASDSHETAAEPSFNVMSARHLERLLGGELMATSTRLDWAKLMRRTLALDPLRCPACGERLRPIAEITDREVIERILDHLATREPRGPPDRRTANAGASAQTLH